MHRAPHAYYSLNHSSDSRRDSDDLHRGALAFGKDAELTGGDGGFRAGASTGGDRDKVVARGERAFRHDDVRCVHRPSVCYFDRVGDLSSSLHRLWGGSDSDAEISEHHIVCSDCRGGVITGIQVCLRAGGRSRIIDLPGGDRLHSDEHRGACV